MKLNIMLLHVVEVALNGFLEFGYFDLNESFKL